MILPHRANPRGYDFRERQGCWQRRKPNEVGHEIDDDVALPTDMTNLIERCGRQNRLIAADDDAVGADAMHGKLFDDRIELARRSQVVGSAEVVCLAGA
jgi:hypothetical protein